MDPQQTPAPQAPQSVPAATPVAAPAVQPSVAPAPGFTSRQSTLVVLVATFGAIAVVLGGAFYWARLNTPPTLEFGEVASAIDLATYEATIVLPSANPVSEVTPSVDVAAATNPFNDDSYENPFE